MYRPLPPADEDELRTRGRALAGRTLGEIAGQLGACPPRDLRRDRGWVGRLLGAALGTDASPRSRPDFSALGIELKSLPVSRDGRTLESTFVCAVSRQRDTAPVWEDSALRRKLARVLWVPVLAEPGLSPAQRRVGMPWLWSPTPGEAEVLRADWEELLQILRLEGTEFLDGRYGNYLQLRPQGAPAGEDGVSWSFYLRPHFTARLLRIHYAPAAAG